MVRWISTAQRGRVDRDGGCILPFSIKDLVSGTINLPSWASIVTSFALFFWFALRPWWPPRLGRLSHLAASACAELPRSRVMTSFSIDALSSDITFSIDAFFTTPL